jgi:peptidoglycan/LPS O-acetylase OafA/YrhL
MKRFNEIFFPNDFSPNHIKSLDGIRGLAVIFVVLAHGGEMSNQIDFIINFKGFGKLGVFFFFVLSAFLLDMYIAKALINEKANKKYWLNYFLRRFLRIYPLFFVSLLIYWALGRFNFIPKLISNFEDIKNHLLLIEGKAMYWSIGVEFKYYLISPLILFICHKAFNWKKSFVFIFLFVVVILSLIIFSVQEHKEFKLVNYIPFFISGTMLALSEIYKKPRLSLKLLNLLAPILLFIIIFFIPIFYESLNLISYNFNLPYLMYAPFIAVFVYAVRNNHLFFTKLFEFKLIKVYW